MLGIWMLLAAVGFLALAMLTGQAQLAASRNRCRQAWAGVDSQLQRYSELAASVAATVELHLGSAGRSSLQRLADARQALRQSSGVRARGQAHRVLASCLQDVIDLRSRHATLAVNIDLARQLRERAAVTAAIATAQQHYNETAKDYDRTLTTLPASLVARMLGLKPQVRCDIVDAAGATPPGNA
ncbi:MAG: LemA family protein [Planctomycetaceae bacterium]|nr:LemA family protein [Planctomycetaceae bacterium]